LTLPANIRVNVRVPFPALVSGTAFLTVEKANGIWTITPNYQILAPSLGVSPTQILALFDTATGAWSYLGATQLAALLSSYRTVTATGAITVSPSDVVILMQKTLSGASTLQLPTSASRGGVPLKIKDLTGDANTNHITIVPAFGETIDGFSATAAAANGVGVIDIDLGVKILNPLLNGGWYVG
jgi:hypothetical protein